MITPKLKKSVLVVLAAAALTACGGGGGSSSGSDTPAPEPTPTPVAEVTKATAVSQFAAKFDDQINQFTCFKGENKEKCGLILYQVMVEAAPNGGDAPGKIVGWGPDNNKYDGTLEGIGNSLDFIKGVGANALWITPVFTSSSGTGDEKTNATGYFASEIWKKGENGEIGEASIDPDFGGLSSFNSLVSKTHEKGMLFILDGVFGHARSDFYSKLDGYSPVPSDECRTKNGDIKIKTDEEVYGSAGSNFTCFDWDENGDENGTKNFFEILAKTMITKYGIDGWRLDQAYQVPIENWTKISTAVKTAVKNEASDRPGAGYMVAEVWSGKEDIKRSVFGTDTGSDAKVAAVESAFNFPLRYKLVQVLAGQEDTSSDEATGREASFIANDWGYGSLDEYKPYYNVMPNMFTDNHDLVRFGNLLFRYNITSESDLESDDGVPEYSLRHLLAFAFMMEYSGPITIYYGSEYGDWTKGFSYKLPKTVCGAKGMCDDHVSRTKMKGSEDELKQWQKDLRTFVGKMMKYRKEHPALFNGNRFHIYSTDTEKPSRDSANFYVDVKKAADNSEAFVFVASVSRKDRTLQFDEELTKYLCQKAIQADSCKLKLVMDTSKVKETSTLENVMSTDEVTLGDSTFAFAMPALSARLFEVIKE